MNRSIILVHMDSTNMISGNMIKNRLKSTYLALVSANAT